MRVEFDLSALNTVAIVLNGILIRQLTAFARFRLAERVLALRFPRIAGIVDRMPGVTCRLEVRRTWRDCCR